MRRDNRQMKESLGCQLSREKENYKVGNYRNKKLNAGQGSKLFLKEDEFKATNCPNETRISRHQIF